jgi:mono/diheme cytochrome c family protein
MLGILALLLSGLPAPLLAQTRDMQASRANYLLSCGGCHGLNGVSNSRLVPDLKDQVGFFMNLPEGRRYVVRLPNVAFSMMTDETLTDVLNYMVFTLGGSSTPKGAKPYTMNEVSLLRHEPLTEVSLAHTRQQIVRTLIDQFHATVGLRRYGGDDPAYPH